MNLVELAQRIKNLRLQQHLTLEQVASQTGLTRSWLSKVENFRVTPSLPALGQIADALGVPVSQLFEGLDRRPQIVVIRRDERQKVERDGESSDILYESLAYKRSSRVMDPFLLTVPPGGERREALGHEGEEFLIVISGRVDMWYSDEVFHLAEGDSLYFDAHIEHRLANPYEVSAEVICVFHRGAP